MMVNIVTVTVLYSLICKVSILGSQSVKYISNGTEPDYTADIEDSDLDNIILESRNKGDKQSYFMVRLYYEGEYQCLASLISDRLVMTAAHCVKEDGKLQNPGYLIGLAAGSEEIFPGPPIYFESIHVLPDSEKDDLAILMTREVVTFGDGVGQVCLSNDTTKELLYEDLVAVSGAAVIDTETALKFSHVKVVRNSRCGISGMSRICVYSENVTLCKGDSGGPLIVTSKQDVQVQIGILLQGATRENPARDSTGCSNLVIYNRVSHYRNFISQIADVSNSNVCFVGL